MSDRDAETEQYISECIGPRIVGTRWKSYYFGDEVTVLAVHNPDSRGAWSITEATDEELARNRLRTHCTPWDHRDRVITQ